MKYGKGGSSSLAATNNADAAEAMSFEADCFYLLGASGNSNGEISGTDVHVYSVDESFIDAEPYLHFYQKDADAAGVHPAHVMAMTMIRDVLKETGITATVGIGTNLYAIPRTQKSYLILFFRFRLGSLVCCSRSMSLIRFSSPRSSSREYEE